MVVSCCCNGEEHGDCIISRRLHSFPVCIDTMYVSVFEIKKPSFPWRTSRSTPELSA